MHVLEAVIALECLYGAALGKFLPINVLYDENVDVHATALVLHYKMLE